MKYFPCLLIFHKKKVNFAKNHFEYEPINLLGCLSLQETVRQEVVQVIVQHDV